MAGCHPHKKCVPNLHKAKSCEVHVCAILRPDTAPHGTCRAHRSVFFRKAASDRRKTDHDAQMSF